MSASLITKNDESARERPQPVSVAVCVCTHNRSDDCRELLQSLVQQQLRPPTIVVVDSCSDAAHARALSATCAEVAARYIRVDEPGLSLARNVAAASTDADWVAYLDDDALAESGWYAALTHKLNTVDAETVMLGGRVTPLWPRGVSVPQSRRWWLLLSCIDDTEPGLANLGANVCGANISVKREALQQIGGFPTQLGRIGDVLLSGEESYVTYLFIAAGKKVVYEPSISVQHKISQQRLTREWAAERAFWEGVTRLRLTELGALKRPAAWAPTQLIAKACGLWLLKSVFANSDDLMIRFHWTLGALNAHLRKNLGKPAQPR